jgi:hypothetical protein
MARHALVAIRRVVHIHLSVGRRTIFQEHLDELAERVRRSCGSEPNAALLALTATFDGLTEDEPGELKVNLDPEHEPLLLHAIDEWMRDAHKIPDDVLALRHALRRRGI